MPNSTSPKFSTSQPLGLLEARPYRRSRWWGITHYELAFSVEGRPGGVCLVMPLADVMNLDAVRQEQLRSWGILPAMLCDREPDIAGQRRAWVLMLRAALKLEPPK